MPQISMYGSGYLKWNKEERKSFIAKEKKLLISKFKFKLTRSFVFMLILAGSLIGTLRRHVSFPGERAMLLGQYGARCD